MPELPEVETICRDLQKSIRGKTISRIQIFDPRVLRQDQNNFQRQLNKQTILGVSRRGKAILVPLSSGHTWVVQLMMTGQMVVSDLQDRHARVAIDFMDQTKLFYNDQRVFGQMRVVKDINEIKYFQILGPEPFDKKFSEAYIASFLKKSKRPIKNILLDHTFVAGIGNIYACEILFRIGISPLRLGDQINSREIIKLKEAIVLVLKEAIKMRGSSMRNYRDASGQEGRFKKLIQVYARAGEPCLQCRAPISRIVQAGRSTFYCMKCQK